MNLNNIMFVNPSTATGPNTNTNANMMIPTNGGHFMGNSPPLSPQHHHHNPHQLQHHGSPNASQAMYHMRQMANYHHHHQQRFFHPQSPPQRSGFSYYHQGPRHFFNPSMMNPRPPIPVGGGPTMNSNSSNNGIWPSLMKSGQGYSPNQKSTAINNKTCNDPPGSGEVIKKGDSSSNAPSNGEHNDNNKQTKPSPALATKVATGNSQKKSEKFDKVLNKQLTKHSKMKRSDSKSSMKTSTTLVAVATVAAAVTTDASSSAAALAATKAVTSTSTSTCVKLVKKDIKTRDHQNKKNDTMQRNSSKASHTTSPSSSSNNNNNNKSHHHNNNNSNKDHHASHHHSSTANGNKSNNHDSSDSGISNGHQQQQHTSTSATKQRKSRGNNKRQDGAASNPISNAQQQHQKRGGGTSTGSIVNDWLQNDMYCYERQFISSCGEDSMIASRHNPGHRNSTSSEATGSDDLNSSSSNEDLITTYIVQNKTNKKSSKSRQKRQQKRKQNAGNHNHGNGNSASSSDGLQPMDIDEDYKENHKPHGPNGSPHLGSSVGGGGKHQTSSAAINLRKQCTKAAALKAVLNNSKLSNSNNNNNKCPGGGINALTTSPSNSSVCSSLSSASSTSSINSSSLSSSASSSPAHSVNSSPTASPTASKRNADHLKKAAQALLPPLRQFTKLNLSEAELFHEMSRYVIEPNQLRVYGFPVESVHHEGCIEIYKCLPKHLAEEAITKDNQRHHRHFYGRKKTSGVINAYDGLNSTTQQWSNSTTAIDSGHGSGDSSPRFTDSDSSEMGEEELGYEPVMAFYTPDGVYQIFSEYDTSVEKQCVRCSKMFEVDSEGKYLTFESCTYHWGKANNVYNGKCYVNIYSCCQGEESSEGCSQHPMHVWNGAVVGINGPYNDFVHTKPRSDKHKHKSPKIYAIDCEMSYTGLGLEVTKVSVVGYDGSLVYEHFVQPQADIVDYNTRFSGITEKDLSPNSNNSIKTFAQVQQDLLKLIDADTILIGHGLDNDLRVLRMVHKTIVDTSLIFSHSTGYPYRRSLKNLTKSFLKRDIQCSDMGHSSFEDSRACLELMLWRVRKDLRHWSYQ
ncbi:RNA exonuclease prage isoform X1 [Haematobia irritans]|uniref:RNA exonuclease prage isoform X1 n=1 Tax=Haematobia irritans TaxID=7368 RepID=UPI003F50C3D6